ncbi:hypothetical protein IFR05_004451 [Cadophora sp. M221]|nr:hypothetical protein IFR05_004451 [Cadophora sp. M221]
MSSYASGRVLRGTQWNYRVIDTVSGDNTHTYFAFKAEGFYQRGVGWRCNCHGESRPRVPELQNSWRRICCVFPENEHQPTSLNYKPANILLSSITTSVITAKVGDLGLVFPAGHRYEVQPYAMRAPEVFLGHACSEPSQFWAVAAMLLCWIKPGVLGAWDSPHLLINKAWSMAKIKRLFPKWIFRLLTRLRANPSRPRLDLLEERVKRNQPCKQSCHWRTRYVGWTCRSS